MISKKDINGFKEIKRLLEEENIISGISESCECKDICLIHNFSKDIPCIWDERILFTKKGKPDFGCYHHCFLRKKKYRKIILNDKQLFIRSIDKYISFLENNPNWDKNTKRDMFFAANPYKYYPKWKKLRKDNDTINIKIGFAYNKTSTLMFDTTTDDEFYKNGVKNSTEKTENSALLKCLKLLIGSTPECNKMIIESSLNIDINELGLDNEDLLQDLKKTILSKTRYIEFLKVSDSHHVKHLNEQATKYSKEVSKTPEQLEEERVLNNVCKPEKEVTLYIRATADYMANPRTGKYYVIMNYKGYEKEFYKNKQGDDTTINRLIIEGAIDAVKLLKEPCSITLNTHTNTSIKSFNREKNKMKTSINFDMIYKLNEEVVKGRHRLKEVVNHDRQQELSYKIRKI